MIYLFQKSEAKAPTKPTTPDQPAKGTNDFVLINPQGIQLCLVFLSCVNYFCAVFTFLDWWEKNISPPLDEIWLWCPIFLCFLQISYCVNIKKGDHTWWRHLTSTLISAKLWKGKIKIIKETEFTTITHVSPLSIVSF